MFLKIADKNFFSHKKFNQLIRDNIDNFQDCILIFREHLFIILIDKDHAYNAGAFKIKPEHSCNKLCCEDQKFNLHIKGYQNITETFINNMKYKYSIEENFPFEEIQIGFVEDYEDYVCTD